MLFRSKDDAKYFGWKGLDPSLLKVIVQKAHAAGLRVSTHVESATDFHNALMAGVDEINHTPGFRVSGDVATHALHWRLFVVKGSYYIDARVLCQTPDVVFAAI